VEINSEQIVFDNELHFRRGFEQTLGLQQFTRLASSSLNLWQSTADHDKKLFESRLA
jgi:hypothetical protein